MATLKQLYSLLLDSGVKDGICLKIDKLYKRGDFSYAEYYYLKEDFKKRKPTIFSKWYYNHNYIGNKNDYWWRLNTEGNKQRRLFIQSIIDKL